MAVETLKARRSIRNFDPNYEITKEQMDTIIECALNSPSALNLQEHDIIVLRNKEIIKKIDDAVWEKIDDKTKERFTTRQKRYGTTNPCTYDCSAIIFVVKNERAGPYSSLDAGILSMGILVAVQGVGLGSVPLGMVVRPEVEEILGLPKGAICLGIAVGKPKVVDVDQKEVLRKVKYID